MSSKLTIAVVGYNGLLGKPIVNALTSETFKNNFSLPIRIITRDISKASSDDSSDIKFYQGNDLDSYVKSLTGVDVVIDVRAFAALTDFTIVDAAKKAGVKAYSPSDYGSDYYEFGKLGNALKPKADLAAYIKKQGLQLVQFHTGYFLELAFKFALPIVFVDPTTKTTDYPGDGSTIATLTSFTNIGQAVASTFSHPLSEIPEQVRIGGDFVALKDLAGAYESATGIKLEHKPSTVEQISQKADDHFTNGTLASGLLDIIRAATVATQGNNLSQRNNNEFVNPGGKLFHWEKVSELAPKLLSN